VRAVISFEPRAKRFRTMCKNSAFGAFTGGSFLIWTRGVWWEWERLFKDRHESEWERLFKDRPQSEWERLFKGRPESEWERLLKDRPESKWERLFNDRPEPASPHDPFSFLSLL